jgi:MarR family transcriptional regulator, lower aerobic nicotinate degradation pathway regulator
MVKAKPRRKRAALPSGRGAVAYALEDQAGHLLRRAYQRHTAIFAAHIGRGQPTATQWAALFKLREMGEVSQTELGRVTAVDAATLQGLIRRLAERGLVAQAPDAADRRRNTLRLTARGEALVAACLPRAARITERTLAPLSPAERRTLLRLLKRLI